MSNQITGRVAIMVKGSRVASKEGATLKFSDVEREGIAGDGGVLGYAEKTAIPEIECTVAHSATTRLSDFQAMTDETVSFDADTGTSYVLSNAWCTGALELSKGELKLKFQGIKCEEVG
ncbi:MAG: phage tail tube protein [Azonexus sp.]|jgi:hypothetical protein|nr:phage tail tube protein [Azonexus sp.]